MDRPCSRNQDGGDERWEEGDHGGDTGVHPEDWGSGEREEGEPEHHSKQGPGGEREGFFYPKKTKLRINKSRGI